MEENKKYRSFAFSFTVIFSMLIHSNCVWGATFQVVNSNDLLNALYDAAVNTEDDTNHIAQDLYGGRLFIEQYF